MDKFELTEQYWSQLLESFLMRLKENPVSVMYLLEYCLLYMVSWLQPLTKPVWFGKHWDSILSWDLHYTVQDLEKKPSLFSYYVAV